LADDVVGVEGTVRYRAVPEADVEVVIVDKWRTIERTTTDARGHYRVLLFATGDFTISARKPGFETVVAFCQVPAGSAARFDVVLSKGGSIFRRHDVCELEPDTYDRYTIK
jgi:hypothetical protein